MTTSLRVLVIGDPHFKVQELNDSIAMGQEIIRIAQQQQPELIVCLGDTLDRFETIHVAPLTEAIKWLDQLREIAPVYLLIGNHDRPHNANCLSSIHPFAALKQWSNLTVVDQILLKQIKGMNFFFAPYLPPGQLIPTLEKTTGWRSDFKAGFSHQDIYGTSLAEGILSAEGDKWPLDWPLLINGHIHDRDRPQANVISVGTPRQHDFDESPDKSISLFSFTSTNYTETRLRLKLPRKLLLSLSISDFLDYTIPDPIIDRIKLKVIGEQNELKSLHKHPKLSQLTKAGIKVLMVPTKSTAQPNLVSSNKSFTTRMYDRVKSDPELKVLFEQLFNITPVRTIRIPLKKSAHSN